jgi:hypothetical protein
MYVYTWYVYIGYNEFAYTITGIWYVLIILSIV